MPLPRRSWTRSRPVEELLQPLSNVPEKVVAVLDQVKTFRDLLEGWFGQRRQSPQAALQLTRGTVGSGNPTILDKVKETLARVELFDKNLEKLRTKLMAVAVVVEKQDPVHAQR